MTKSNGADSVSADSVSWDQYCKVLERKGTFYGPEPISTEEEVSRGTSEEKPRKVKLIHVSEFLKHLKPVDWVIRDFIQADSLCTIIGPYETGKSLILMSMAVSVASGEPWMGNPVKEPGPVILFVGEGFNGMARRVKAAELALGTDLSKSPLFISDSAIAINDLDSIQGAAQVIDEVAEQHGPPRLIGVDTLQRNFGPGDENSTQDMSTFIRNVDIYLRSKYRPAVIIAHHTPHADSTRSRGSTVLISSMDIEYLAVKVGDDAIAMGANKMKDAEKPAPASMGVVIEVLPFVDEWGRPVKGAAVRQAESVIKPRLRGITPQQVIHLDALKDLVADIVQSKEDAGMSVDMNSILVSIDDWNDLAAKRGLNRKNLAKSRKSLHSKGLIEISGIYAKPTDLAP